MQKDESENTQASVIQPPAVKISASATLFEDISTVSMSSAFENLEIRYTLDGSEPNKSSLLYSAPFTINKSALIHAKAYTKEGFSSRKSSLTLKKAGLQPAIPIKGEVKGLKFKYYEGEWNHIPDYSSLLPVFEGIASQAKLSDIKHREDHFSCVFEGFVNIPYSGLHTFYLNSDDGSKLYLNGALLINHDGDHSSMDKKGEALLQAGKHRIRIEYFEKSGSQDLEVGLIDSKLGPIPFTPFQLSHQK
jgi:hypothetical protein